MLLGILLTVQILISVIIIVLVLIQRSEGGALGMGGGPSGFMSARGAGNLLTKATSIMGVLFFVNCIGMTVVGNYASRTASAVDSVDTSKLVLPGTPQTANSAQAPAAAAASSSAAPSLNDLPLAGGPVAPAAPTAQAPAAASRTAPAAQRPATLPAPLSSSTSSQAPRVGSIFANSSSSSAAPSQP